MRRRRNEQSTLHDLAFLIGGIGIGSGIALLLAPSSGEDLRYEINRRYRKIAKNVGRRTVELRDRAEDFLDNVHDIRDHGSKLLHLARTGGRSRLWA